MSTKTARWIYWLGLAVFAVPTALRVYLLQPFPGSQGLDAIGLARWLHHWIAPLQIAGAALAVAGLVGLLRGPTRRPTRVLGALGLVTAGLVFYGARQLDPARMFRPFSTVALATGTSEALPATTLVIGIVDGDEAKAYPIRLLAYHHRLEDTLQSRPIWVTYCTMCRTGKIFRPEVDGRRLHFDLVGARRRNSVYEDRETGSWWYQASGRAAVGPLAGARLPELLTDQMTLESWLALYPDSLVLQPDPAAADGYTLFGFDGIDERRDDPELPEGRRWVVGVEHGDEAVAYPWSLLAEKRWIEGEVGGLPVGIHLADDLISFRAWDRRLDDRVLEFEPDPETGSPHEKETGSRLGLDGVLRGGELDGRALAPVNASQEYWSSFEYFSGGELYGSF